ncbi:MAG TPA: adenylate/guanylate cyclase domain-containing protein, partial [Marmoricola sp.]|nr:adenylate/guanylate cyclase domain-containing protein [Marmoricola sp.]
NAELTELREALVVEEPDIKVPSALVAAGRVVGAVMGTAQHTAQRLRDEGMGGMLLGSLEELSRWALDQRSEIVRIADEDGTVTIFFSDIEGSTRLNSTLGDERWVKVLAAHDELVETYVEKYRGLIVKTQGDGHMVVFSTPQLAVAAALDINRGLSANWNRSRHLRRTPIRVRIGLHKGTAIERDGDYFGQNVALAARIAARAQGGEILVSEEVAQVLDAEYGLLPAESVELKGFDGKHTLWQVEGPTG